MIRGAISLVIVGAVMLAAFGLVSMGPRAFEKYLPEQVVSLLERGMAAGSIGGSQQTGETAADMLADSPDGLKALGPIAAMPGNSPVLIKDVIDGYTSRVGSDIPAEITMIRPISGCRLTPPLEGTRVGHVTAGATDLALPMLTYNDATLAAAVQSFVNAYREGGTTDVPDPTGLAFEAYDVAVTATDAPVYLVLESSALNRIWNIHLAAGARIERVILLGGTHAGVANLDPVIPVEVLPGDAMTACGIDPAYLPNTGHRFFEVLKSGTGSAKAQAEATYAVLQDRVAAYNTWFRDSFGVQADTTRAGFDDATVSVIGPQPGDGVLKAVYAKVQGSRIRMTQDTYFELRGQVPEGEDFAGRVKAITTTFAFGDLANLRQGVSF